MVNGKSVWFIDSTPKLDMNSPKNGNNGGTPNDANMMKNRSMAKSEFDRDVPFDIIILREFSD